MLKGEDTEAVLARMLGGGYGPLLDCSGVALRDGRVVGAIVCTRLDGEPWVLEVFREPGARGAGRALLERALALCEGPTLGLAVTEGNPAVRLYEALGFERVHTAYSVDL
jgi:GNAT superfamily N-acetyltransferase